MLPRIIFMISSLATCAWGQGIGYGNPLIQGWDGQYLMWTQAKGGGDLVLERQGGKGPQKFRLPFKGGVPSIAGNRCITFVPSTGTTGGGLLHRWVKGSRWETLATVPQGMYVRKIHILGNERFLLVAGKELFVLGDAASPYAVAVIGPDGTLKLEKLVQVPLKDGYCQRTPPANPSTTPPVGATALDPALAPLVTAMASAPPQPYRFNPDYRVLRAQQSFSPEQFFPAPGGGGVLVFHYPGYLFVLDAKGEIKKSIRIYPDFDESNIKKLLDYEAVLLGAAWAETGELLLAAREKKAVFESHKLYPLFEKDGKTTIPPEEAWLNQEKRISEFPKIKWMALDVDSGKLRDMDTPPQGAPFELFGKIQPMHFSFLARKDGAVEMKFVE